MKRGIDPLDVMTWAITVTLVIMCILSIVALGVALWGAVQ